MLCQRLNLGIQLVRQVAYSLSYLFTAMFDLLSFCYLFCRFSISLPTKKTLSSVGLGNSHIFLLKDLLESGVNIAGVWNRMEILIPMESSFQGKLPML